MFKSSKKILALFIAILFLFSPAFPSNAFALDNNEIVKLSIIGTSDMHGDINGWVYESEKDFGNSGLARAATIVKQVRAENKNTILIDNGDTIQGNLLTDDVFNKDLSKPNPLIAVMNQMNYDAMVLGNHEFNFGLDLISKIQKEATFPLISSNIYYKSNNKNFVQPYIIKEYEGVKVAILGFTVPSVPIYDGNKVSDLYFNHMAEEAQKWVKILKEKEKVDVIIASAHAGLDSRHLEGEAAKLIAERCPEIDVLLLGHDHTTVQTTINGVLIAAPNQSREVVRFDISLSKVNNKWSVTEKTSSIITLKDIAIDADTYKAGETFHKATLEFLKGSIGESTGVFHPTSEIKGIPEAQIRDTAVIDLINKVQLKITGADVSAAALFKSDANLPEGKLNYGNIFNIYKYSNTLIGVEVTGKQLKDYMEWSASYYNTFKPGDLTISFNENIRGYSYDMFAGVDYKIDISKPVGERIVDLKFKGKPLKDDQIIKLAINDYRYNGIGSNGEKIITNEPYFQSAPDSIRYFIKQYIEENKTISPETDNNWQLTGYKWDKKARELVVYAINNNLLKIPKSKDERTENVRAITVEDLKNIGLNTENKYISIVHTNDTHGRLKSGSNDGMGFARISTRINQIRDIMGNDNVLVVDAGDTLHGQPIATISKGESIVKVLNAIEYDVMVPGNHDFNYGQDRLLELSKMLDFPVISANVIKSDGSSLFTPYVIKEVNGIKIGIFGLTTPETTFKTHPKNIEGLTFKDPVAVAKEMVDTLKDKTDIIIALSHLGVHEGNDTSEKVAQNVSGIDLIIDGHSHTTIEKGKLVNGTWIAQTGEYDKNLGIVTISIDKNKKINIIPTLLDKSSGMLLEEDKEIADIIKEIEARNDELTSKKVGFTDVKLVGEREFVRAGETNMGNLITNAMLYVSKADVALTNGGGIRASIDVGEIIKKDIINVLPFGNQLVTIKVTGKEILAALEVGIDEYPAAKGAFPHIAGMTMKFNPKNKAGERVIEVLVNGKPINPNKTYTLATNDFVAAGGDNYKLFGGKETNEFQALDEVVMEYIVANGLKDISVSGRVTTTDKQKESKIEVNNNTNSNTNSNTNANTNTNNTNTSEEIVYIVVRGDTLWQIAKMYNMTYQALAKYNNISNPNYIIIGQRIIIPAK